jgi:hypothetical protein
VALLAALAQNGFILLALPNVFSASEIFLHVDGHTPALKMGA